MDKMVKVTPLKDWNSDFNEYKFRLIKNVVVSVPEFILANLKTEGVIADGKEN